MTYILHQGLGNPYNCATPRGLIEARDRATARAVTKYLVRIHLNEAIEEAQEGFMSWERFKEVDDVPDP